MDYKEYGHLAACALGKRKAQFVLKHANVINVFSEEIIQADIAIENGIIIGVGSYDGETNIDLTGKYICPGFIDAHLHLESTLAAPADLINLALKHGTTTFIVDPHEVANVAGEDGIDYILQQTENLDANVLVMLPSCVPVTPYEENGSNFTAEKMSAYHNHPRVLGLGEVMDYSAVIHAEPQMMAKLALFQNKVKDGHAPGLSPKQLSAYTLAKIKTDHECIDYDYAMQEIRNGMYVLIREGSGAKNLQAIVSGIVEHNTDTSRFAFCTDDKHLSDIEADGHISHNVKKSIQLGIPPVKAIKMATLNAAVCYGFEDLGAIAPGYRADLIVLENLDDLQIHSVYCNGKLVKTAPVKQNTTCPDYLLCTIHVPLLTQANIALPVNSSLSDIIEVVENQIITRHDKSKLPTANGYFVPNAIFNKVVVIERHNNTGHVGIAAVRGFGIRNGAIGTSMSHDSHNIVIIGDNDHSILCALEELKRVQGGYTLIEGEQVCETLPLPIMGLMTEEDNATVEKCLTTLKAQAHAMGIPKQVDPLITLSFIALPVIPEIRVTTKGLFDVVTQQFI